MTKSHQPILSIITVVFNNVAHIERTLNSVINQSYKAIQYIVIDGGSTDGTLKILQSHKKKIDYLVSEPDHGIYDAMNKGLMIATGDYVLFMNSGDEIYALDTVEKVFATSPDADIYYGETLMMNDQLQIMGRRRHKVPNKLTLKSFKYGMSVSHQAIYIRRSLTKFYDPKYHLSADIDWILDAISKAKKMVNTHMYVAKYLIGGLSKKRHQQSLTERYQIFRKYYGLIPNLFNHGIIAMRLGFYFLKNRKTND
ncbi:MAG: glycosyltransferase family 2 protein [Pelobium sp.]